MIRRARKYLLAICGIGLIYVIGFAFWPPVVLGKDGTAPSSGWQKVYFDAYVWIFLLDERNFIREYARQYTGYWCQKKPECATNSAGNVQGE